MAVTFVEADSQSPADPDKAPVARGRPMVQSFCAFLGLFWKPCRRHSAPAFMGLAA